MGSIVEVLTQNIFPIFLVAGLGFLLRRVKGLDPRVLAGVVFNGFSPCLVFVSLVNSQLSSGELVQLGAFTVLVIMLNGLVALLVARLLRLSRMATVVLLLTVMFVNGGNYGLTLNQLRYGEEGLARAVVYYIVSSMLAYTLGVFIVSMGHLDWRQALRRLARVPAVYAVVLAITVYSLEITIPRPVMSSLELAAAGAIPAMLVVLGMNMAGFLEGISLRLALPAISLRLIVGPLLGLAVAGWLGLHGLSRSTSIVEASMPPAVLTTLLATEFDVQPGVVTSVVVVSTLFSPITLGVFITLLTL